MGVSPVKPPDKRTGPEGPARLTAAKQASTRIVSDRRNARRRAAARELERLAPLAVWYRQPKGGFYCTVAEGWAP
jgi:hypothetical protein